MKNNVLRDSCTRTWFSIKTVSGQKKCDQWNCVRKERKTMPFNRQKGMKRREGNILLHTFKTTLNPP